MKRVRETIRDAVCLASLSVCVAGAVLWVRSYQMREGVYWNFAQRGVAANGRWGDVYAYVFRGALCVGRNQYDIEVWGADGPAGVHYRRSPRWTVADDCNMRQAYGHGGFGFEWLRWRARDAADYDFAMVRTPLWAICMVTLAGPLLRLRGWVRLRCRLKNGMCAGCGYDLRATPGRCSECGRAKLEGVR